MTTYILGWLGEASHAFHYAPEEGILYTFPDLQPTRLLGCRGSASRVSRKLWIRHRKLQAALILHKAEHHSVHAAPACGHWHCKADAALQPSQQDTTQLTTDFRF